MLNTDLTPYESLSSLEEILELYSFNSIVLVTGNESFNQERIHQYLLSIIQRYSYVHFKDFVSNPTVDDVLKGIQEVRHLINPLYIAIGGGSVMDMAKLVMFFSKQTVSPINYFLNDMQISQAEAKVPLIAIPTTAGTGSEATQFGTLYINQKKYSLDRPDIQPSAVILDYLLTMNLPKKVTAESGVDALSQAIESYWSINSTDASKEYAKKAINLIYPSLAEAYHHPNAQNRERMLWGAYYAGKAINITRTTAPHAISYPLTSYFGIAHGQAVSLTLPYFLKFNSQIIDNTMTLDPRGVEYVQKSMLEIYELLDAQNADQAFQNLRTLFKSINLICSLSELGITEKEYPIILENGFTPSRMKNNPRLVNYKDVEEILKFAERA